MKEEKEPIVSETVEPVSELRARWAWAEPSVWTDRMLGALEDGIAGVEESKWFCLIDKVYKTANLESAYAKTARKKGAAGVDHVTVKGYANRIGNLTLLSARLNTSIRNGSFSEKADAYRNSELLITKHLPDAHATWNSETIAQRQSMIADHAIDIWSFE